MIYQNINKNKFRISTLVVFVISSFLFSPVGHAVIPPDFIFSIGTQIVQVFSVIIVFFITVFGTFFQFFKAKLHSINNKKFILLGGAILIVFIAVLVSYFYVHKKQEAEYQQWLDESKKNSQLEEKISTDLLIADDTQLNNDTSKPDTNNFYEKNKDLINIKISNEEFYDVIKNNKKNYIILDARENIEFEIGHLPRSIHIRFVDIKAGRWKELLQDKLVYVYCWSGMRGQEVAEFLRTKKIVATSVESGANGWFEYGGLWEGDVKISAKYPEKRYKIVFSTEELKQKIKEGAFLVDSRQPDKFNKYHINGSVNIATMHIPSANYESFFSQIPPKSKIITICDDYTNCFDAKLTGIELERRGHEFLGRYNKPWEYEK